MRVFLFKILFKLTWWVAPNKNRVDKIFEIYLEYIEAEENYIKCQEMQKEKDACIRPRTETFEWLSNTEQREFYYKGKPIRGKTYTTRRDYTDYDEAQAYHDGQEN